jgi:hypothetical protein
MRAVLPKPYGEEYEEWSFDLVAALRLLDVWQQTVSSIDANLPAGTRMFFANPTAPEGWIDVSGGLGDRLIRSSSIGAATGGSWQLSGISIDPRTLTVANLPSHLHGVAVDAVAAHSHTTSTSLAGAHNHGSVATDSRAHSDHGVSSMDAMNDHSHVWFYNVTTGSYLTLLSGQAYAGTINTSTAGSHAHSLSTSTAGAHAHSFSTDAVASHNHGAFSATAVADHLHAITVGNTGGGATHGHSFTTNATWRPAYLDVMACERLALDPTVPMMLMPGTTGKWDVWARVFTSQARLAFLRAAEFFEARANAVAPLGARAIFVQSAPPAGWVQDTTWNDRVIRVANSGGGTIGGSWALSGIAADLHTLTESELPPHSHTATVSLAGAHGHAVALDNAGSHFHTGSTDSQGDHAHTGASSTEGGHAHAVGYGATSAGGFPLGGSTGYGNIQTDGVDYYGLSGSYAHVHDNLATTAGGAHNHTFTTSAAGAHAHAITIQDGTHTHTLSVQAVGGGLGHSHSFSIAGAWRPAYVDAIVCYRA